MNVEAKEFLHIRVKCSEALSVGDSGEGFLRVIPITGGEFAGDGVEGEVVGVGADWNVRLPGGRTHVYARYLLRTADGHYIQIENEGFIDSTQSGRFSTFPRFAADQDGPYSYFNTGVYAGELGPCPDPEYAVEIRIYRL